MASRVKQYGKWATLSINQRMPLIEGCELRGSKTLFVRPVPNWPTSGGLYPFVPGDLEVIVRNKVGAAITEDTFALPTVGLAMQLNGDGLEVFVYYSPKQGLVVPYPSYDIEAGVTLGHDPRTPTRHFWSALYENAFGVTYPATSPYLFVPSYSRQVRVATSCHGRILMYPPDPTGALSVEYYDFNFCSEWTFINPEMAWWRIDVVGPAFYTGTRTSVSVEFR